MHIKFNDKQKHINYISGENILLTLKSINMKKFLLYLIAFAMINNTAYGWNDDASKNTQITPTGLTYFENDVKTNKNGMTYIFMLCGGNNISMRLQIVDPNGERLLARGGEIISQEPNRSWFGLNQYLELDKEGNAFIGVQDYRKNIEEEKLTYSIYKYDQTGKKILDGITLNDGIGHKSETGLSMCATDDGGCVCAYIYTDVEKETDYVVAEKISGEGKSLWRKTIFQAKKFTLPYPFLTDAGNGRILTLIVSEGKIKAQIIKPDGTFEKTDYETVYTEGFASSKIWETMRVEEIHGNKTMISIVDGKYQSRALVINSDGTIGLDGSDKGIQLSDDAHASAIPAITYNEEEDTYTCFYEMQDINYMALSSLWLKKINGKDGSMVWTEPKELLPTQQENEYGYYVMRNAGEGRTAIFYMKKALNNFNDVKGYMQIIENDGSIKTEPVAFTTALSNKQTLRVSELVDGQFITAWDDKRNPEMSLFMQNVKLDGTSSIDIPGNITEGKDTKTEFFSINGMKLDSPQKGLNIIRVTEGNTVKTIKIMK